MNVNILENNPDWRRYLLVVGTILLLTISVWLLFKYPKVRLLSSDGAVSQQCIVLLTSQ